MWDVISHCLIATCIGIYVAEYNSCDEPPAGDAVSPMISFLIASVFIVSHPDLLTFALILQAYADHHIEANSNSIGNTISITMFAISHVISAFAFVLSREVVVDHLGLLLVASVCAGLCMFVVITGNRKILELDATTQMLYLYSVILILTWMIIRSATGDAVGMTLFIIADCLIIINTVVAVPKRVLVVPLIYWAAQYYLAVSYRVL
jgi:magnesium-transporting ATPase (P-type)